jgi:regulatory protein
VWPLSAAVKQKPDPHFDTASVRPECRTERGVSEKESKRPARTEVSLRTRAMRSLARREHSRAELKAKLLPHVQEGDDLVAELDALEKRGWLSDERATDQLVNQRRARFGAQRIAHELRQKGIAEAFITDAMPRLKEGELEAAREVWKKKFGALPANSQEKARQVRFLQSRGFALDVIFRVVRGAESDD